jgi:hypothetical protein
VVIADVGGANAAESLRSRVAAMAVQVDITRAAAVRTVERPWSVSGASTSCTTPPPVSRGGSPTSRGELDHRVAQPDGALLVTRAALPTMLAAGGGVGLRQHVDRRGADGREASAPMPRRRGDRADATGRPVSTDDAASRQLHLPRRHRHAADLGFCPRRRRRAGAHENPSAVWLDRRRSPRWWSSSLPKMRRSSTAP